MSAPTDTTTTSAAATKDASRADLDPHSLLRDLAHTR